MTRGSVSKIVTSFGSRWGRIQPAGEVREVFFNSRSLDDETLFLSLELGQLVDFEERPDYVTGSHAEGVVAAFGPENSAAELHAGTGEEAPKWGPIAGQALPQDKRPRESRPDKRTTRTKGD